MNSNESPLRRAIDGGGGIMDEIEEQIDNAIETTTNAAGKEMM